MQFAIASKRHHLYWAVQWRLNHCPRLYHTDSRIPWDYSVYYWPSRIVVHLQAPENAADPHQPFLEV